MRVIYQQIKPGRSEHGTRYPSESQLPMHAHRLPRPWRSLGLALAIVLSSFATLLIVAPTAAAVTYVSGTITTDTVWGLPADDTYVLTADVTVDVGVTLTILPGTRVLFDPLVTLFVEGALYADGDSITPIRFAANDTGNLFPPRAVEFPSRPSRFRLARNRKSRCPRSMFQRKFAKASRFMWRWSSMRTTRTKV